MRVQHQHIQSFRRTIYGRGQARWSRTDDYHVTHTRLVDRLVQTETVRDLLIGRVPKDDVPTADHHRHILDGHAKPIERLLDVRITIEVDEGVWMPGARPEFFAADRTGRVQRADKYRVAKPSRDEFDPAENERAHEDLAEFGVGLHKGQ